LSEKALDGGSGRVSSHGDSTDESGLANKHKSEGHAVHTPAKDGADLTKLDSKVVKVEPVEDDPFRHLPLEEAEILKRQVDVPVVKSGFGTLYRYATFYDKVIIGVSITCAIAGGAALPLMTVRPHKYFSAYTH